MRLQSSLFTAGVGFDPIRFLGERRSPLAWKLRDADEESLWELMDDELLFLASRTGSGHLGRGMLICFLIKVSEFCTFLLLQDKQDLGE
jgi:hypothetical protein